MGGLVRLPAAPCRSAGAYARIAHPDLHGAWIGALGSSSRQHEWFETLTHWSFSRPVFHLGEVVRPPIEAVVHIDADTLAVPPHPCDAGVVPMLRLGQPLARPLAPMPPHLAAPSVGGRLRT